jgi:ankyrin repeat protein
MGSVTEAVKAVRAGDVETLVRLLAAEPALAEIRVDGQRTLLHVATDWPGHFPNVRATVAALALHGADLNSRFIGPHSETPLHWAASSDDVEALDALLDHGAELEAPGGVIGGGTALADAVAFAQWNAARRLVERGARTTLWQAAALGLMERVEECFAQDPPPGPDEITNALWNACHGGQLPAAQYLVERGADVDWVGHDGLTPFGAAGRAGAGTVMAWLREQGAAGAPR